MSLHFWALSDSWLYLRDFLLIWHKNKWKIVWEISGEIVPMAVLVTDRIEEGSLGIVTTFWHHDQAKVKSSEVLSTLCQQDSPKPNIVVVKIFHQLPLPPNEGLPASFTWM